MCVSGMWIKPDFPTLSEKHEGNVIVHVHITAMNS